MTIGVIGLVFSIIFTAISLLMTSNAQKKEEKKSHALVICVAGICIFSVFSIVGFFKSIGSGL
jgi:heme/copper-type cytochrome/quinol oxidase subunit 4